MNLQSDFKKYKNKYGFITENGTVGSNQSLFNAFYLSLALRIDEPIPEQAGLYLSLVHPSGVIMRQPDGGSIESHDNTKAVLWASKELGLNIARRWLAHGRMNGWNFNSVNYSVWDKRGAFERFPAMIAQAKISAGETIGIRDTFYLCLEFFIASFGGPNNIEAVTLPYFIAKTVKGHSKIVDVFIRHWRNKKMVQSKGRGLAFYFERYGWRGHAYVRWYEGIIDV